MYSIVFALTESVGVRSKVKSTSSTRC